MKKVGFIDYYLDEWHSNNYPKMIQELSNGELQVCYAYGMIEPPIEGRISNQEWSQKQSIELINNMEELIEKSDYLVVLSPDNPEIHEKLCFLPLKSGKNTYVDKTFAPDKETAIRIFEHASKYNTPCYSSSALRFASEYSKINLKRDGIEVVDSIGPGSYEIYSIHQIEPIVSLMGTDAKRVLFLGDEKYPSMLIEYSDGRRAQISHFQNSPFLMNIGYQDRCAKQIKVESPFFEIFVKEMVAFFITGNIPVAHEETIAVIAIREAGLKAMKHPYIWIEI